MQLRIWAAFGGAALTWGSAGVATRAALDSGVPPIALTAIRAIIATVVLVALARWNGKQIGTDAATWRIGGVMAVFNLALPFLTMTFAYRYASAGFVGFIIALIPLVTALMAHYVLDDEPVSTRKLGALTVALAGVALLLSSGDSGLATGGRPLLAAGLTTIGVLAIGYSGVYAKKTSGTYHPITLSATQFGLGIVLLVPLMLIAEGLPEGITAWGWALIVYLSVVGSVVPFLLYYWVITHVSSTSASTIGYLVPLVSLVAGIVLLDEQLQFGIAAGGALILAGVVLTGRVERRAAAVRAAGP